MNHIGRCSWQHVHPGADRRWVELFPHQDNDGIGVGIQHMGRFGSPEVVHTNCKTAFHNELVSKLLRMTGTEQSLTTAYSSEESGIVERANQEVLRHLNAILFDTRVHDKWSFEQLPMVQYQVMERTNSRRLGKRITTTCGHSITTLTERHH